MSSVFFDNLKLDYVHLLSIENIKCKCTLKMF